MIVRSCKYLVLATFAFINTVWCYPKDILSQQIKIKVANVPVDSVFRIIENQSGIHFVYFSSVLPGKKFTLSSDQINLGTLLDKIFRNTNIEYKVYENQVMLSINENKIPPDIKFRGQIVEQNSNLPISYATIEIKGKYKGTISDKNGYYELLIPSENYLDTILISSMGYEKRIYLARHFNNMSVYRIYLKEKIFEMPGVDVFPDEIKSLKLGNYSNVTLGSIYLDTHGQQTALFIKNEKHAEGDIKNISYYLSRKGNTFAPLRVHIYLVDTINQRPGKELLPQMVVIKPKGGKGWTHVDLSPYNLKIPKEGMFVAIEGVFPEDYNEFYTDNTFEDEGFEGNDNDNHLLSDISYGQRIGYNNNGKNNTWHYSITKTWFQIDKRMFNVMIGAQIVYSKKQKRRFNFSGNDK